MKIPFNKIGSKFYEFCFEEDEIFFKGNLKRLNTNLVECRANIKANLNHICSRCGDDLEITFKDELNLILSDGYYKNQKGVLDDVIEFFDGFIDIKMIALSEIESFKSDYFYCKNCKN